MVALTELWLPILLSAVGVFIASSIVHMVIPWHKNDYPALPNEKAVRDALRPFAMPPGDYMVPRPANQAEMRSQAFMDSYLQGPNFVITVLPNQRWSMGTSLAQWFVYCLVISIFAAYVTGRALGPGAEYLNVFRFAGVTAFLGFSAALWQMSIWYRRNTAVTLKSTIDGLLYALVTAGFFGWLWP